MDSIKIMDNKTSTPSNDCKRAGLKSLAELAKISGVSVQTLINWHKNKPQLFAVVIAGAVCQKNHLTQTP